MSSCRERRMFLPFPSYPGVRVPKKFSFGTGDI
jgi:hypothetical protein